MKLLGHTIFLLTLALSACASLPPPNIPIPKKEPPATRFEHQHPRVILVLGSGSARGFSHVGVIKVLQQNHIPIDMIIGTSAGSIVGVLYADKPSALDLEQTLLKAKRNEVIDFSYLNIIHGPVSGAGLQRFLLNNLSVKNFDELQIPFAAVATDLQTGKRHVFASGPIPPAINASSAAPPFFRPVVLYGKTYIDGGVVDPVAVDIAERFHPDIIIAVNLDYPLTATLPTNGPSVFLKGFEMMLLELSKKTASKANIIIEPNTGNIDMFEEGGRARLMQAGADAATKALPAIKQLLAEKNIKN